MKKDKILLSFKINYGEIEYHNYAIITEKQNATYNNAEIISNFFDDSISDEQYLSDGRFVIIDDKTLITDQQVEFFEKTKVAYLLDFDLRNKEWQRDYNKYVNDSVDF